MTFILNNLLKTSRAHAFLSSICIVQQPYKLIALSVCVAAGWCFHGLAEEEQSHGVLFERAVIDQLLERSYTAEWDLPAAANRHKPGVPASVKFIRWGNSIYLGDAIRQRSISEPFQIIVGFYDTDESNMAIVKAIHVIDVTPDLWKQAWGDVTLDEIIALDLQIKQGTVEEAQGIAKVASEKMRNKQGIINIHPKINKDQRRIQCAITFKDFHQFFFSESDPKPQDKLELWGKPFPKEIHLGKRSR